MNLLICAKRVVDYNVKVRVKNRTTLAWIQEKGTVERPARLVPLPVPTVKMAGGSVRCMIAGIYLSPRH